MKKFLSIVAVIALVFALAVPAFAANSSPDATVTFALNETKTVDGKQITLKAVSTSETPDAALIGEGNEVIAKYEISLVDADGNDVSAEFFAAHALAIDFGTSFTKVLHKIGGSWIQESNVAGNVVTVSQLSPFALIKAAGGTTPASNTPAGGKRSPQTGYNTVLWAISAAAMVACAGYCFISARKKDAE